jgi:hypothetical protein
MMWHRRETRRPTEKTKLNLHHRKQPAYSPDSKPLVPKSFNNTTEASDRESQIASPTPVSASSQPDIPRPAASKIQSTHGLMSFQLGDKLISDRHLQLAGRLSVWRSRYQKAGLLDANQPDSPLAQHFQSSKEALRSGALDIAELEILNLAAQYMELGEVGKYDSKLLPRLKRRLRSHRLDDYLGVQCEIAVAGMLLKKSVQFICPDPPDFEINLPGSRQAAFIECTSIHIEKDSNKELIYKVGSAINDKKKKGYCNARSALVIDITNVMYHSHKNGWNLNPIAIKERFAESAANSGFGAVLIFCEVGNLEKARVETLYSRLAVENPSIELQTVLDQCFPDGEYIVTKAVFPRIS